MIDHTGLDISDPVRSRSFYQAALAPLGYQVLAEIPKEYTGGVMVLGMGVPPKPDFWLHQGTPQKPPLHIAFHADSRALVDAFYQAALAAGGKDNGPPARAPTTTRTTTAPSSWTPTATTSKPAATPPRSRARCSQAERRSEPITSVARHDRSRPPSPAAQTRRPLPASGARFCQRQSQRSLSSRAPDATPTLPSPAAQTRRPLPASGARFCQRQSQRSLSSRAPDASPTLPSPAAQTRRPLPASGARFCQRQSQRSLRPAPRPLRPPSPLPPRRRVDLSPQAGRGSARGRASGRFRPAPRTLRPPSPLPPRRRVDLSPQAGRGSARGRASGRFRPAPRMLFACPQVPGGSPLALCHLWRSVTSPRLRGEVAASARRERGASHGLGGGHPFARRARATERLPGVGPGVA